LCNSNTLLNVIQGHQSNAHCNLKPRSGRIGGGVAIYVRDHFRFSCRTDLVQYECDEFEFTFVCLDTDTITVGVVYRPPNTGVGLFNQNYSALLSAYPIRGINVISRVILISTC